MTSKMVAGLLLVASAACESPEPGPDADGTGRADVLTIKSVQNPDLDVLFVIDDSSSMADKQNAFNSAFPALLAQLSSSPGGLPNVHIGVTTTDMGTKGSAVASPGPAIGQGCSGTGKGGALLLGGAAIVPTTQPFINQERNGTKNYTGTIGEVFAQMATVGSNGCGFEQPLAGMRAALDNHPANTAFVRETANLAVVILSDEDDCSILDPQVFGPESAALGPQNSFRCFRFGVECAEDVTVDGPKTACHPRHASEYVEDTAPFRDFLLAKKGGDARKVMISAIAGNTAPVAVEPRLPPFGSVELAALAHSCSYMSGANLAVADPPVRIAALLSDFPGRTNLASVCDANLTPVATSIGKTMKRLVGDPCLEHAIALPADCVVVDVSDAATDVKTELPACSAGGSGDCYELVDDAACTDGPPLRLVVTRATPPSSDTWTTVRCKTP